MVILDYQHINKLKKAVKDEYLSCGVITGYKENGKYIIKELLEMENEASEKKDRKFLISPDQYLEAEAMAEEKQLQILGFYYISPAKDSNEPEIKHAFPGIIYIASQRGEISAWNLSENRKNIVNHNIEIRHEVYKLTSDLAIAV